jgi:hypothetical protein
MKLRQGSALLLVALLAGIAACSARKNQQRPAQGATGKPVEMSSMAITFYNSEYQPMYGSPISQCELLVRRAAKHGSKRIQFVPTHYWYEKANEQYAPNTCHADNWSIQNKAEYYCQRHEWNSDCVAFNPQTVKVFADGIKSCFKVAAELFDEIMVAPHLDEGLKRGKWRNMLHFDPLWEDPNGNSYWSIMLKPILDAANEVLPAGKTFWFGVEGEMGGTVMSHPAKYLQIYDTIRKNWRTPAALKLGFTVNHAYVMGYINRGPGIPCLPPTPMAPYDGGFGPVLPFEQWPNYEEAKKNTPAIKSLIAASDFMGVSNYARAPNPTVTPSDIESSTQKIADELAVLDINLQTALKGKVFMFNEFGLGGGLSECGDTPGTDHKIGLFPWLGVTTSYDQNKDPFKKSPAAKNFVVSFYQAALTLLKRGGGKWPVHHAYIWNCVSWDVQGIHTASAIWNTQVDQGDWPVQNGFAVQEVIDMIKSHNKEVLRK